MSISRIGIKIIDRTEDDEKKKSKEQIERKKNNMSGGEKTREHTIHEGSQS